VWNARRWCVECKTKRKSTRKYSGPRRWCVECKTKRKYSGPRKKERASKALDLELLKPSLSFFEAVSFFLDLKLQVKSPEMSGERQEKTRLRRQSFSGDSTKLCRWSARHVRKRKACPKERGMSERERLVSLHTDMPSTLCRSLKRQALQFKSAHTQSGSKESLAKQTAPQQLRYPVYCSLLLRIFNSLL